MMRQRAGITLIEMIVVVALIGMLVGISFPAATAGIESLRLSSASNSIVSFLNGALNRAERRQQVMEVTVSKVQNALWLRSGEPGYERKLALPEGITIAGVLPAIPGDESPDRLFYLYPSGTVPRLGVELVNRRGARRIVRVDPITGVPDVESVVGR